MKTRIVYTDYWREMASLKAPKEVRLLYRYIFSNEYIGMSGIYQLDDIYILLETGLTEEELQEGKKWLENKKKVFFHERWIYVVNAVKRNNYKVGAKNTVAYNRELSLIPQSILKIFKEKLDSSIDSTIDGLSDNADSTQNQNQNQNHKKSKKGVVKGEEKKYPLSYLSNIPVSDLEEFVEKFKCTTSQVTSKAHAIIDWCKENGKRKENYKATLNNWLRSDYGERPPKEKQFIPNEVAPDVSEEERQRNRIRIAEIKQSIHIKKI